MGKDINYLLLIKVNLKINYNLEEYGVTLVDQNDNLL